jgi:hypothetical protein
VRPTPPYDRPLVVMGVAGSGKSTIASALSRQRACSALGESYRDRLRVAGPACSPSSTRRWRTTRNWPPPLSRTPARLRGADDAPVGGRAEDAQADHTLLSNGPGRLSPAGLQYPVLTAPDSVLPLITVEGVRLERHIYLMLPSVGETSPAARRFADQLLRIHPAGS